MADRGLFGLVQFFANLYSSGVSHANLRRQMIGKLGPSMASSMMQWMTRNISRRSPPRPPPIPSSPTGIGRGGGGGVRVARAQPPEGPDPEEHPIDTRRVSGHFLRGKYALKEIETPQSSNVYSFAFDGEQGILFVTFKAPGP